MADLLAPVQAYVMPASIALFLLIYALAYAVLFGGWRERKARHEACSCAMSVLHASVTAALSAWHLLGRRRRAPWPWRLDAENEPLEVALMSFSTAYFLVDLLHYALFAPEDVKFVLHHLATSAYMMTCKHYAGRGGVAVVALMGLGEVTSPLQSLWTIARLARSFSPFALAFYHASSLPFTLLFTIARGFFGPILAFHLCAFYLSGRASPAIPYWLSCFWMALVVIGLAASLLWVRGLWIGLLRFRAKKKQHKQRRQQQQQQEEEEEDAAMANREKHTKNGIILTPPPAPKSD